MSKPFISICIPTYKRADLLKKLLDSICAQTFTDFEILINDNSPDDTVKDLVSEYEKILPIAYQKNEPAISATENCNKVMGRANADWIKIMHDDDWFAANDALAQFADAAKKSGKDFIFCASICKLCKRIVGSKPIIIMHNLYPIGICTAHNFIAVFCCRNCRLIFLISDGE